MLRLAAMIFEFETSLETKLHMSETQKSLDQANPNVEFSLLISIYKILVWTASIVRGQPFARLTVEVPIRKSTYLDSYLFQCSLDQAD